ncbi:hypothetical protein V2J09_006099 [Rumex salicifolius]
MGRLSGEDSNTSPEDFTNPTVTERTRGNLHNFSLPYLKWGEQRQLRCVKVFDDAANGGGGGGDRFSVPNHRSTPVSYDRKRRSFFEPKNPDRPSSSFQPPAEFGRRASISNNGGGIGAATNKIMFEFQTQVERLRSAVLSEGSEEIEPPPTRTAEEARPWNLRTRRSACKDPSANGVSNGRIPRVDEQKPSYPLPMAPIKSPTRQTNVYGGENGNTSGEKRPRAKLRVPLMKQEIEDDFVAMTGIRPPRRPKKRPRLVQKQIDRFLPGLWISEIKASMYKVNENADGAKTLKMLNSTWCVAWLRL